MLLLILIVVIVNLLISISIYFSIKKITSKSIYAKHFAWVGVSVWYFIILCFAWKTFYVLPLPSDEYMANHFHKHRLEFDAIVKAYREEHLLDDLRARWDDDPRIEEMKIKVNIWDVSSESGGKWFDDPYSMEAAKQYEKRVRSGQSALPRNHSRDGVVITLNNGRAVSFRERAQINKEYLHLPKIPRIEDGKLLYPVDGSGSPYAKQKYVLVRNSLDSYPEHWKNGECFVKPLDVQWFIKLCKSY